MQAIVASANIFRREFTSYVLAEAGYAVEVVTNLDDVTASLAATSPLLLVLDAQLASIEPALTLQAVRLRTRAPILWIASASHARPLMLVDARPSDAIAWPFPTDELLNRAALLLGRAAADLIADDSHERSVGSPE